MFVQQVLHYLLFFKLPHFLHPACLFWIQSSFYMTAFSSEGLDWSLTFVFNPYFLIIHLYWTMFYCKTRLRYIQLTLKFHLTHSTLTSFTSTLFYVAAFTLFSFYILQQPPYWYSSNYNHKLEFVEYWNFGHQAMRSLNKSCDWTQFGDHFTMVVKWITMVVFAWQKLTGKIANHNHVSIRCYSVCKWEYPKHTNYNHMMGVGGLCKGHNFEDRLQVTFSEVDIILNYYLKNGLRTICISQFLLLSASICITQFNICCKSFGCSSQLRGIVYIWKYTYLHYKSMHF